MVALCLRQAWTFSTAFISREKFQDTLNCHLYNSSDGKNLTTFQIPLTTLANSNCCHFTKERTHTGQDHKNKQLNPASFWGPDYFGQNLIIIMAHSEQLLFVNFCHSSHSERILLVNSRIHSRQKSLKQPAK